MTGTPACRDCGKIYDHQDAHRWHVLPRPPFSIVCDECRNKRIQKAIEEHRAAGHTWEHYRYNPLPICPHCGHANNEYDLDGPGDHVVACPGCVLEYVITPEFEVITYTTAKREETP